jgi:4a-hydroxytetrahydrobiopterin dehydratase
VYVAGLTERITPGQFHEAVGVEDWRALLGRACAHFRTGSFLVTGEHAPAWWTLAGDEGNEANVATWMGRE